MQTYSYAMVVLNILFGPDIFNVNLIFLSVFDILVYLTSVKLILSFT